METIKVQAEVIPGSGGLVRFPKLVEKPGVRYVLCYEYNGIQLEHTYHPFWDCLASNDASVNLNIKLESCRMVFLDFSNNEKTSS
jgi:hypothetical protein